MNYHYRGDVIEVPVSVMTATSKLSICLFFLFSPPLVATNRLIVTWLSKTSFHVICSKVYLLIFTRAALFAWIPQIPIAYAGPIIRLRVASISFELICLVLRRGTPGAVHVGKRRLNN